MTLLALFQSHTPTILHSPGIKCMNLLIPKCRLFSPRPIDHPYTRMLSRLGHCLRRLPNLGASQGTSKSRNTARQAIIPPVPCKPTPHARTIPIIAPQTRTISAVSASQTSTIPSPICSPETAPVDSTIYAVALTAERGRRNAMAADEACSLRIWKANRSPVATKMWCRPSDRCALSLGVLRKCGKWKGLPRPAPLR